MDATYAVVNKTRRGGGAGGRDSTPFGRETASFDRDHAPFGKDPAPPGTPPSLPGSPLWRPSPTLAGEFGGGGGWRGAGGGPYSIHMTPSPHRCAYGSLSRPYRGWMIPPPTLQEPYWPVLHPIGSIGLCVSPGSIGSCPPLHPIGTIGSPSLHLLGSIGCPLLTVQVL